jgi:hypothetical protein
MMHSVEDVGMLPVTGPIVAGGRIGLAAGAGVRR